MNMTPSPNIRACVPVGTAVLRLLGAVLLALLVVSPALAQGRPPPRGGAPAPVAQPVSNRVEIDLMVVHATNEHNRTDPRLSPVLKYLSFLNYKGFTLLSEHEREIAVGSDYTFNVAGGRRVQVDVVSRDETQVKIRVQMFNEKGRLLDSTLNIRRNKSFMVGGPEHEGGVLVMALTARY